MDSSLKGADLVAWLHRAYPHLQADPCLVDSVMEEAFRLGSQTYGRQAACTWAGGWKLPLSALQADERLWIKNGGDFEKVVEAKLAVVAPHRLSTQRVHETIHPDNPWKEKLFLLAEGQPVLAQPDFRDVTYETRPKLSQCFLDTAPAVERMFYESYWENDLAVILSGEQVRTLGGFSLCQASWAPKLGKECGRPITNGSGTRTADPLTVLNSPYTKAWAELLWGRIHHPTIGDVVRMGLRYQRHTNLPWADLVFWKFDLKGAYTLVGYHPLDVRRIGVELSEDRFMFFLAGVFGLTAMPFAFNVVTQAIVWEVSRLIRGLICMYVDDGFGVSRRQDVEEDQRVSLQWIRTLLGPRSIAPEKSEVGRAIDMIGYRLDLDRMRVALTRRNLLKTLYAFASVDLRDTVKVTVKVMQGLASLASRYGTVCVVTRPFAKFLYQSFTGCGTCSHVTLGKDTKTVIRLYQSLLLAQSLNMAAFSKPLQAFHMQPHRWVLEFDASLTGIGIIWYRLAPDGQELPHCYASVDTSHLGFLDDSTFQNTSEFLGMLLAVRGLQVLGFLEEPFKARGDSVTALTWGLKGTPRSMLATRAGLVWAMFVSMFHMDMVAANHLSNAANQRTDCLSRHGSWEDVLEIDSRVYGGSLPTDVPRLELECHQLLSLCNPATPLVSDADFGNLFSETMAVLSTVP